ncbi:uncharacterized protein LOC135688061 [Rhopilema esculentum]|uniref:uncharacterized protein LOC135688061 n=1 Tax=Rhopilema esculentum TaxID=499914 RepID=UPI0031D49D33
MESWQISLLVVTAITVFQVHGYCVPGTDTTLEVVQPVGSQKVQVPASGTTKLEVRYKGHPAIRWYVNGKEIPTSSQSPHYEFVKGGPGLNQIGPILKIKNFKKELAGDYKVTINKDGCVNSKTITVALDKSFNLQFYIDTILNKVPYLKTKAGICLFLVGIGFLFVIIPLMICGALCSKIRKLKKELRSEKGKIDMYFEYETKNKGHSKGKHTAKKKAHKEKSTSKERESLIEDSSSSDDHTRPKKKHKSHHDREK